MTFKCYPSKVEIYCDGDHFANVTAFDEGACEIECKSLFSRADWDEAVAALKEAVWMVTEPFEVKNEI